MDRHLSERAIRKRPERTNSKMFASVSSFTPKDKPVSREEPAELKRPTKKRKKPSKKQKPAQSFRNVKSAKNLPK